MRWFSAGVFCCALILPCYLRAVVFGSMRGIVHDPSHRPIPHATVTVKATRADRTETIQTHGDGTFEFMALPVGEYDVSAKHPGFQPSMQNVTIVSGSAPVLHFELTLGSDTQSVTVSESALSASAEIMTPTTVITRDDIQTTPGADLSNSLSMITNYVPGAWITHDQLHIRGGHQVTWAIDGVPIPNTNIASNVGPQIDPKDIDYLEAERGGYSSAYGDRSYGVFDVVPRTGFERNNEAEVYATYGTFHQTNEQINYGNHSEKLAYFASLNGNRSDYGLQTIGPDVLHDRVWGVGGMGTVVYNGGVKDQLRLTLIGRSDDYQIPNDPPAKDAGMRAVERERDALVNFSWAHTFAPGVMLVTSPFYHFNRANYDGDPNDAPISTTQHRDSQYAGAQVAVAAVSRNHNARFGIYGWGQYDEESVRLIANDGSGDRVAEGKASTGQLEALFLEDQYKVFPLLTLNAGVRLTHFAGKISENAADPRLGGSVRIPRLNWILRGFWGEYYQAPPLSTVSGPLLEFAVSQGLGVIPLRGERDQEHQFGVTIPLRGWSFESNNYHQRARNYFDHDAIENSNVFFPLTIDNARLYGWEVSVRSPKLWHRGDVYLTYACAHAEGAGAVSGGLTDFSAPDRRYFLLDHDQRHTMHTGFHFSLPYRILAGGDIYYGSGFTDGSLPYAGHLEEHTTFDLTLGKSIGEKLNLSVTALNLLNRRFLLDNSLTFGGTHYADPRQIYGQLRYQFHF